MSDKPSEIIVHLTKEQADLLLRICDSHVESLLELMAKEQRREALELMVGLLETIKGIKKAVNFGSN